MNQVYRKLEDKSPMVADSPGTAEPSVPPTLIYIHGFNSSPRSEKAELVAQYIEAHQLAINYLRPSLPGLPDQAIALLRRLVKDCLESGSSVALLGSSLGGYYAANLAREFGLKMVLVNPAVRPYELLDQYLGQNKNPYTGEEFVLDHSHMEVLKSLQVDPPDGGRQTLVMVQTGDETLDFRDAAKAYFRSPCIIEHGGNHRYQDFEKWIPYILEFLQLS